ncbi:TolC family protein [uncultured Pantoea sp.]|uniref:TolC family protein n=1 Tax=uncultured Pantoea sp. TaxID=218084 RepID=UPI00258EEBC6|nr:TolC family protein [uncultured Pantoea sp.]
MKDNKILPVMALILSGLYTVKSHASDIFDTEADVPSSQAAPVYGNSICEFGPLPSTLALNDALERSLCNNPKTAQSWAEIKAESAAVGTAKGAYLPTFSLSGREISERSETNVAGHPEFGSVNSSPNYSADFSLNWVLYDFGARSAALHKAKALLVAAEASHMETLQSVMIATAKDYYAAQAAAGNLAAAADMERIASKSVEVVVTKEGHGAASVGDELQARTAWLQAKTEKEKAENTLENDLGVIAIDMGLRPDSYINLANVQEGLKPDFRFKESVSALIDEAIKIHPALLAAQAQLQAAEAEVDQTRAEGMPTLSLIGKASRDNQKVSAGIGQPYLDSSHNDRYIGIQVSVPLFEGFTREYKIQEGLAQAEQKQGAVSEVRHNVELDVWKSFQSLKANTNNLPLIESLFDNTRKSYSVAEYRYENGVGNIIELLNAQKSLADAEKQQIQALTDWRYSRLELSEKLGLLGLNN